MDREFQVAPIPRLERVLRCRVPKVPTAQLSIEGKLIASKHCDIEVLVRARLPPEEEVERPAPRDPPRRGEASEELAQFRWPHGLPRPQEAVIARTSHRFSLPSQHDTPTPARARPIQATVIAIPKSLHRTGCDRQTRLMSRPRDPATGPRRPPGDVRIRPERRRDDRPIDDVVSAAFGSPREARLVEKIRASSNFVPDLSIVAEIHGQIVGHVMISYVVLHDDQTQHRIANLSPLAVTPDSQRLGIGSALVREVTARADDRGEPVIVLEGSPKFYGRLGFEPAAPRGIHIALPSWAPPDAAQLLRLRNYDPSIRGRVVYPPAFDEVTEH